MNSSTTGTKTGTANAAFIKKFKTDHNVKTQTKLPSQIEAQNAKAVADGYTVTDAIWWRRFVEMVKYDPDGYCTGMNILIDMMTRCHCGPIALINFGRTTYGFEKFDCDEICILRDNMLAYEPAASYEETSEHAYEVDGDGTGEDDDEKAAAESSGKRKRLMTAAEALETPDE